MVPKPPISLTILMVAASITVHLIILGVCYSRSSANIEVMLKRSDAHSYLQVADLFISGRPLSVPFAGRVFPGWPICFAPAYAIIKSPWVPVVVAILISCVLPLMQLSISGNRTAAIIMICGTPTLLMHSVLAMSEPLFLLLTLGSCLAFARDRSSLAALLTGVAAWVRPTSCFLWLGQALELVARGRRVEALKMSVIAGLAAGSMFLFNAWLYGSPFYQFGQYGTLPNISDQARQALGLWENGGSHFGMPMVNLIKASLLTHPPLWKQAFVWGHVVMLMMFLVFGSSSASRSEPYWTSNFVWAAGTGLFILCTGPYWAFHSFDRYFVWALPAYLALIQPWLKRTRWFTWAAVGLSVVSGLGGVLKA